LQQAAAPIRPHSAWSYVDLDLVRRIVIRCVDRKITR
jgi:hypothetical protein